MPVIFDQELSLSLRNGIERITSMWYKSDQLLFDSNQILHRLLNKIVRYFREEKAPELANDDESKWVKQVEKIVDDQIPGIRNGKDLAGLLGVSPKHLAVRFQKPLG